MREPIRLPASHHPSGVSNGQRHPDRARPGRKRIERRMKAEHPYRILVVDDDASLHGVFACMLAREAGIPIRKQGAGDVIDPASEIHFPQFEIDFAFQGKEGLELVRKALAENRPYTM